MPKGKPKAKNPDLYEDEDSDEVQERKNAPQAVAHARGGRWEIKDHLKTGTHWDDMPHVDLKRAVEDAGLYTKDMGKVAMIHALAKKDRIDEMEARAAERERRKKRKMIELQKRRKERERIRKKEDRQRRRNEGEDYVSDTTESESDGVNIETDDESYTTGATPTSSSLSFVYPAQRLRIYEWPYESKPPTDPPATPSTSSPLNSPQTPVSPWSALHDEINPELHPKKLPYAVMKLVTTTSKEKLELPGRQYPEEVGPDFVPPLSEHAKDCARNGVLYGQLQRAVIERGTDWAKRTIVQWWNGRMYLNLPPRGASKKVLADVYAKWNKKKKRGHKQEKGKGRGIDKVEPKRRAAQRLQDQRQKMLDIYAVSEYRPPICYVPSYLDFPLMDDDEDVEKSIDNLFYIRFTDMDLPHYYFWSIPGEWEDPTQPNPEWLNSGMESVQHQTVDPSSQITASHHDDHVNVSLHNTSGPSSRTILVKKAAPRKFRLSSVPPKTSKYKTALWGIEKDLFNKGCAIVLKEARERWVREGKVQEWKHLIRNLPGLYPAGRLPTSPPVNPPKVRSLAEKLAAIEVPSELRPIESIVGDEPWTRDDEAYWHIVHMPTDAEDNEQALLRKMNSPTTPYALERRISEEMPMVTSWISKIPATTYSPSFPPSRKASTLSTVSSLNLRQRERMAWEDLFLHNVETDSLLSTTIEQMPVAELKHNLYLMMKKIQASHHHHHGQFDHQCEVCLQNLGARRRSSLERHYQQHETKAIDRCPFCGAEWNKWPSEAKASHIFFHHSYQEQRNENDSRRRRSSTISNGINALYAIPRSRTRSSMRSKTGGTDTTSKSTTTKRKMSKVSFSPVTVERRVAYNDAGNNYDADVSSITTLSPRRSSLKRPSLEVGPQKMPHKSRLKIDTNVDASSKTMSGKHRGVKRTAAAAAGYENTDDTSVTAVSPKNVDTLKRRSVKGTKGEERANRASNAQHADARKGGVENLENNDDSISVSRKKRKKSTAMEKTVCDVNSEASHPKDTTGRKRKRSLTDDGNDAGEIRKNDTSVGDSHTSQDEKTSSRTGSIQPKSPKLRRLDSKGSPKSQASSTPTARRTSSSRKSSTVEKNPDFLDSLPPKTKATPSKRKVVPKTPSPTSNSSRKSKSPKEIALETKKSAATTALASRRASKQEQKPKTTILGRPYVEPLVLAPARRWSKKSGGGLSDILSPPTPHPAAESQKSDHSAIIHTQNLDLSDDQLADTLRRGRRSSAPTPSPTLTSHRASSISTQFTNLSPTLIDPITPPIQAKPRKASQTKKPTSSVPIDTGKTKRRHSYDVPYSEPRLIVPPNTPANRLVMKQKRQRARSIASFQSSSDSTVLDNAGGLAQSLDIAELSDKIKEIERQTLKGTTAGRGKRGKGEGDAVKDSVEITAASVASAKRKGKPKKGDDGKTGKDGGGRKRAAKSKSNVAPRPQPTRKSARLAAGAKAAVLRG
ncbi:hypothetical protein DM02DRAFT_670649 [Periconia macrospinosa]|uniref:Uncharacterized protein n=1 Tax=Periconia macrospinosa TaxID=97972 RepID=A0A2V1DWQ5_9PLEO|nr:hypothetical protein DM02DRAFT_670649 [Periconia macrospinosa]